MLIGIVGALGAGKGTVVEYLTTHGFRHYSASGYLKEQVLLAGEEPNRDSYSALASKIRTDNPAGLAKILYERYQTDGQGDAVIESLHDVGEVEFIHQMGGVILGLDADMELRYERARARNSEKDQVTFDEFKAHIEREENGGGQHNIRAALAMADHTIVNNGSIEELHAQIEDFLAKFATK